MQHHILTLTYIIASLSFIIGLKLMGNPKSARKGNLISAAGMILAIIGTLALHKGEVSTLVYVLIFFAISIGTAIGWTTSKKVQMTKIPELVSIFNGMGGACAALISLIEYNHLMINKTEHSSNGILFCILSGLIIGSISFSGSMVAFLKLNGSLEKPIRLPNYNLLNIFILVIIIAIGTQIFFQQNMLIYLLFALALMYGMMFVLPIGGADMPVVISLLNSFTGVAAAFGGFLYGNQVMLTGGILVGSAGTLLTLIMCKAMNRPLISVIFGAFGNGIQTIASTNSEKGSLKDISITDTATLMNFSKTVIVVPGYGLAVAQAQHALHELEILLVERGIEVKYAIHPVAGRMPGHMNVLLAEANVDYDKLGEMDDVNPEFQTTDVVLVVGANDVVNPAAKTDPSSPIYGMPILEVENAKNIIIIKRSMNPGYAGIDNLLFYNPKTFMLFGDAKGVITKLVAELKTM